MCHSSPRSYCQRKPGKEAIVKPVVVHRTKMTWAFEIDDNPTDADIEAAKKGTKAARGANFVCLLTGAAINVTLCQGRSDGRSHECGALWQS